MNMGAVKPEDEKKWDQIRRLLDDESPAVRGALISELKNFPEEGVRFLEKVVREPDHFLAKHAHSLLVNWDGWTEWVDSYSLFVPSDMSLNQDGFY